MRQLNEVRRGLPKADTGIERRNQLLEAFDHGGRDVDPVRSREGKNDRASRVSERAHIGISRRVGVQGDRAASKVSLEEKSQ
jgi:hypothetical protein